MWTATLDEELSSATAEAAVHRQNTSGVILGTADHVLDPDAFEQSVRDTENHESLGPRRAE